jgi:hypothetical protein
MVNTSATGGYLAPGGPSPPEDDSELDGILQAMLAGIAGLPAESVRLLWLSSSSEAPDPNADTCAFGVLSLTPDANPAIAHDGASDGVDVYQRHMDVDVQVSFYGPNARRYGQILGHGVYVSQNAEAMRAVNMAFVRASALKALPELVNQQWIRRYDLTLTLRRQVVCTYQVLNILSADPLTAAD